MTEKKRIVILNGSGGVGKDTFVECVSDCIKKGLNSKKQVWNYSSVDKVKQLAELMGWDGTKTERNRKFLSDLKMLLTDYNDLPFNSMKDKVEEFNDVDNVSILFLHIREPQEIERAKREFNATTILIKRDSIPHITSNAADNGVFNYNYDVVIDNNGSKHDLWRTALDITGSLIYDEKLSAHYDCKGG